MIRFPNPLFHVDKFKAMKKIIGNSSGVALIEFAAVLPFILLLSLGGAELANYVITRMRISQIALHIADHSSRISNGSLLSSKKVREVDINDVLTGAGLQTRSLDLYNHGRVILSSLQPMDPPKNEGGKYEIAWQRCRGTKVYASSYGEAGDDNLDGIGPTVIKAPANGAVVFVEVIYDYQPLLSGAIIGNPEIHEIAAMVAREAWDLNPPYNNENVQVSNCTTTAPAT